MGKVITERGKRGSGYGKKSKKQLTEDQQPSREKIHFGHTRDSSWNHNALVRILASSIGKNWNKIHSGIRSGLNFANEQQQNAYKYGLMRHVCQKVKEIKTIHGVKVPFDSEGFPAWGQYWVHPTSGQIMQPVRKARPKKERNPPKYIHIADKSYRICFSEKDTDGHWYEVELVPIPLIQPIQNFRRQIWNAYNMPEIDPDNSPFPVFDMVLGKRIDSIQTAYDIHGCFVYAKSKRQLNGKEIKKLGLTDKYAGDVKKVTDGDNV